MKKKTIIIVATAVLIAALSVVGTYNIKPESAVRPSVENDADAGELAEQGAPSGTEPAPDSGDVGTSADVESPGESTGESFGACEQKLKEFRASGDVAGAFSFISTIADDEIRKKCIDTIYDRKSESSLIMGNTPGNYANGANIAFGGDAIFYSNQADGKKLYKLEAGFNTCLVDDKVSSISVVGDDVYFVNENQRSRIFKIKTSGGSATQVGDVPVSSLMIIGGKMYFINLSDMKVYSMKLDGTGLKKLSDNKTMLLFYYGAHLYTENEQDMETTLRLSLDGKDEEVYLLNSSYFVTGYDDMLYFRDNADVGIWVAAMSGGMYGKVHESRSGYINTKDGYVYFIDLDDNGSIIKMNLDCSEKTKLASDDARYLALDENYIYYFSKAEGEKLCRINTDGTNRVVLN